MTATSRDLTPAQTSAAMVTAARRIKTALAAYRGPARAPTAGWDERACVLGRLQLVTQNVASCVSYGGYAASNTMEGIPGTLPGWIKSATHAAACEVQDGANHLRAWRELQEAQARPLKPIRAAHQIFGDTEVLYDLLVRRSGTYRLRPGDAPEFTSLLAGCCKELAAALCAEAKYTRRVLGDDPAQALVYAGGQATRGWAMLGPVVRNISSDIGALPPRARMRTKAGAV